MGCNLTCGETFGLVCWRFLVVLGFLVILVILGFLGFLGILGFLGFLGFLVILGFLVFLVNLGLLGFLVILAKIVYQKAQPSFHPFTFSPFHL